MTKADVLRMVVVQPDGCWKPHRKPNGKGYVSNGGKGGISHVTVYELWHGPLPRTAGGKKFQVDHRCRNRWCWSPFHLRPATNATNSWIADIHKRGQQSRRHLRMARLLHDHVGRP